MSSGGQRDGGSQSLERRIARSRIYLGAKAVMLMGLYELRTGRTRLTDRLRLLTRGFQGDAAELYGERALSRSDAYLSDWAGRVALRSVNQHPEYFDQKFVTRGLLLAMGVPQADTVGLTGDGRIVAQPFGPEPRAITPDEFDSMLLAMPDDYIVKPIDAKSGAGIVLVQSHGGTLQRRRGGRVERWSTSELGRAHRLVERRIRQGAFWRALHSGSSNTIRVVTLWTPGAPAPFVSRMVQRIGTTRTEPVDSWGAGGLAACVDAESGTLSPGRGHPRWCPFGTGPFDRHPESGAAIAGQVLPHLDRVRSEVLRAATRFPQNIIIAWDVLVDDDGTPFVIEGNANGGIRIIQLHGGLLEDPQTREFFERTRVVPPRTR